MEFLNPGFLFGLFAISIPIIIHLFNFKRYKTLYFSDIRFIKNIKQETKSKSQLKHLLILLARILAIAAIIIAFARPVILSDSNTNIQNPDRVCIYLDNSFSMNNEGEVAIILENAKSIATEIIDETSGDKDYLFITNDFEPAHQYAVNKEKILDFIYQTEFSPFTRKYSEILERAQSLQNSDNNLKLYYISDFQKNTSDIAIENTDSTIVVKLIPVQSQNLYNISIDSVWFATPTRKYGQPDSIRVSIRNHSEQSYSDIPVKLYLNDTLASLSNVQLAAFENSEIDMYFTNSRKGIIKAEIEISDYPITFDNKYYFDFDISESIKILIVNESEEDKKLNSLFKSENYFEVRNSFTGDIDFSELQSFNLIIINQLKLISSGLIKSVENFLIDGGSVAFIPNLNSKPGTYTDFCHQFGLSKFIKVDSIESKINKVELQHPLFYDAFKKFKDNPDFPEIRKLFILENKRNENSINLLETGNQIPVLTYSQIGNGSLYFFTSSHIESVSTLATNPLFVPVFYNIALNSESSGLLAYTYGFQNSIDFNSSLSSKREQILFRNIENNYEYAPYQKTGIYDKLFFTSDFSGIAGTYDIIQNEKAIDAFSMNYNREESDLITYSDNDLEEIIAKNGIRNTDVLRISSIEGMSENPIIDSNKELWRLFIILSLFFLLSEILIIRLWK